MDGFGRLIRRIAYLEAHIEQLNRRMNNMVREGRVNKVYPDEGLAEVDAHGAKTKKIPWISRSGSIRDWVPPEEDERVLVLNPTGEPGKGLILPGGYSDKYQQPHDKVAEARRVIGDSDDLMTGSKRVIQADDIILKGRVTIIGGYVVHNNHNIGADHRHEDVEPGPSLSGPPEPKAGAE